MVAGRPKLGNILIEQGVITEEQIEQAMEYQDTKNCRLGQALIDLDICSDVDIARALAKQLEMRFIDLLDNPPSPECIALLPQETALEYCVLPIRREGNRLLVAAFDPYDIRIDDALRHATGLHPILALAPESQLREQLRRHYSDSMLEEPPRSAVDLEEVAPEDESRIAVEKLIAAGEKVSTVRVVNTLIADAVRRGASDLHIEPDANRVCIRCRIDGRMCVVTWLPSDLLLSVIARIKIMAGLDIAESRRPQDGGCTLKVDGRTIELRVSTLRGVHGEMIVMRILSQDVSLKQMDTLGLNPEMERDFRRLLAARCGMVLVTGPTGSGKTTSLYAALNHLNREDVKIITVEDPVESKIQGINQVQVHERAGRTFAGTLRSMLRQDPDMIMVGEIRDVETADIACRAALTGHLVLSTLHTQHTLGTVARLLEMGLEPWIIASCLNGVMAQRLVRRVCDNCAADYTPPANLQWALKSLYGSLDGAQFRKGKGCPACLKSGTRGRIGVYELLMVDDRMRDVLAKGADLEQLRQYVAERGLRSMEHDAFCKACQGLIPPEEILTLGFGVAMAMEDEEA